MVVAWEDESRTSDAASSGLSVSSFSSFSSRRDVGGESEKVLVEGIAAEKIVLERVLVESVVPVVRVASCQIHNEHLKDSVCHLWVDPSQPLHEHWDRLDCGTLHFR